MTAFRDRTDAGRQLAALFAGRDDRDPVVLALPRGGVPVAFEIARALQAPLDLVMVRKLGVPWQPELAAGAVADGDDPEMVINETVAAMAGLDRADMEELAAVQLDEIARRRSLYLAGRTPVPVAGRTAILVDDGIATGATIRAALGATRRRNPARLVLAVPVAARDTLESLRPEVDEILCPLPVDALGAVGLHYGDFTQVSDQEVVRLLSAAAPPAAEPG
uniref:Phosphoribosyltransferase domain-containing protein n=1 Tax=Cereibacter sphaeroides (strain ATCC 17025 / ATH 2.4.3) TaxID=349102 RepID=A4WYM0_CERS5